MTTYRDSNVGSCDQCLSTDAFIVSTLPNVCDQCEMENDYAELEADAARKLATQNLSAQVQSYALGFLTAVALGAFLLLPWLSEGK